MCIRDSCVSVLDEAGRFAPVYNEEETMTVPCENVFLSIGQSIEWGELLQGSRVELAGGGRAKADALTYQTAEPDVFVGGDVYTGPKFAIDAIAAGKEGAVSIHRFVQPKDVYKRQAQPAAEQKRKRASSESVHFEGRQKSV